MSGIRQLQIARGLLEPKVDTMPQICQVLRRVKIEHSKGDRVVLSQLPITPTILRLRQIWIRDCKRIPFDNIMLWAACLVTLFSFHHSGEITVEYVNQYDPSILGTWQWTIHQISQSFQC